MTERERGLYLTVMRMVELGLLPHDEFLGFFVYASRQLGLGAPDV